MKIIKVSIDFVSSMCYSLPLMMGFGVGTIMMMENKWEGILFLLIGIVYLQILIKLKQNEVDSKWMKED
jgi:hypothetical protein